MAETAAEAETEPASQPYVPGWLPITSLLIAVVGLGISVYMTYEHFNQNASLACASNSIVDCAAVTTSPQSMVFGKIPVAILGLVFFVGIIPLLTPMAWGARSRLIRWARMGASIIGVGFVFYLVYVEFVDVGKICEWCTGVHILTLALFAVIMFGTASLDPLDD